MPHGYTDSQWRRMQEAKAGSPVPALEPTEPIKEPVAEPVAKEPKPKATPKKKKPKAKKKR